MIFAANFKMNHTRATTKAYMEALSARMAEKNPSDRVLVFPPVIALDHFDGDFTVGAQNAYPAESGAYTGETGLAQLQEFGIDMILIGHSERREILHESQESIAKKYQFYQSKGFEIVYCIGEPLEVREEGDEAVAAYLLAQFEGIDTRYEKLIVAYEPIWAIGTGRTATVQEISTTHQMLKSHVDCALLYGGSVKPDNIQDIVSVDGVDGVLVGGASLKVDTFMALVVH